MNVLTCVVNLAGSLMFPPVAVPCVSIANPTEIWVVKDSTKI